jgi:hypothetical protein
MSASARRKIVEQYQTIEQLTARVRELEEEKRIAELIVELEHIREQKNLLWFEFSIATQQLAAEQLNNKLLREALEFLNARIVTMDLGGVVERALSHPASTEALDEYVAEKVKEATLPVADELQKTRITDFGQYQESHEQVATLTRQRDLAVEALKEIMEYAGIIEERCDSIATDKARAAIKESEGKR